MLETCMLNIHLGDAYLIVEPYIPAELTRALTYWRRFIMKGSKGGSTIAGENVQLYTITTSLDQVTYKPINVLITLPGFAARVYQLLLSIDTVQFFDERIAVPEPDMNLAMAGLRPYQCQPVYDAIASRGGIAQLPTGFGKTHMIAAIIRSFNRNEMKLRGTPLSFVVTPGIDLLKKNFASLEQILVGRDVGIRYGAKDRMSDDVTVVSVDSLENIDMAEVGILIYDECHTLTLERKEHIMRAPHALRWGFSASPTGKFDGSDILGEGTFGPIVTCVSHKKAVEAGAILPILVVWLEVPVPFDTPVWSSQHRRDRLIRAGVWRNDRFHALVGSIFRKVPATKQIIGVAETTEHLNFLSQHLPEGTVIVHAETAADNLKDKSHKYLKPVSAKERNEIYKRLESGELKRAISTSIYRQGVDFPCLEIIVNLAGGGGEIATTQLPGRACRTKSGKSYGLLVDFRHTYDFDRVSGEPGPLMADCSRRERIYKELGFEQVWLENVEDLELLQ